MSRRLLLLAGALKHLAQEREYSTPLPWMAGAVGDVLEHMDIPYAKEFTGTGYRITLIEKGGVRNA